MRDWERKRRLDRQRIARVRAAARLDRQAELAERQAAADEELATRYGGDEMAMLLDFWRETMAWPAVLDQLASQGPVLPLQGAQEGRSRRRARGGPGRARARR
jgi:hypothetical protein